MFALLVAAAIAPVYRDGPFTCSVPIVYVSPTEVAREHHAVKYSAEPQNAQSDIDLAGTFHHDFGIEATFTLPRQPENREFYANWLILIPYGRAPFVQLNLLRWPRYNFRNEISLTWALSDGRLIYRDLDLFVTDAPHQLRIADKEGAIVFAVDGKEVCHTSAAAFFSPRDRLYYQLGTEVSHYGDRPSGTLSHILVKNDGDTVYKPAHPTCVYRGYGVSWEYLGNGRYAAEGVFDPTQPYLKFTGNTWNQPCTW